MKTAETDRTCALALVRAFRKKYLMSTFGLNDEQAGRAQLTGIKPAEILRYYFGGSTRHWGNLLYNNELPTRLDLQVLRASIEIQSLDEIRQKSIMIRSMQRAAEHGEVNPLKGAKAPIERRDGSVYDADTRKTADEVLDRVFGKRKMSRHQRPV